MTPENIWDSFLQRYNEQELARLSKDVNELEKQLGDFKISPENLKSGEYQKKCEYCEMSKPIKLNSKENLEMKAYPPEDYKVHRGDKISQLVIVPVLTPTLEVVQELDETERGENGFGSTGR